MMHTTKTPGSVFRAALLLGLGFASLGVTRTAQASSDYPAALAAAIAEQYPDAVKCVPLCTACHLTTVGGPGMMNKFGMSLESIGGLLPGNAALVAPAFKRLAMVDPDSDGDGTHDIEEITAGDSPSLAFPDGQGQFCSDIKYGCGAHIAAAPPVDRMGLLSAGLVVLGLALSRRRRGASHRRPASK
jgi:hypothetical protein